MTKLISSLTCLFLILSVFEPSHAFETDTSQDSLVLSIGRSHEWPTDNGKAVVVSNGSIIRVTDLGKSVRITGRKLGSANVRSGDRQIQVNVIRESLFRDYERIHRFLQFKRGLKVTSENDSLRIRGRLLRVQDWFDLAQTTQGMTSKIFFEAAIAPDAQSKLQERFKALLDRTKLPQLTLIYSPAAAVALPTEPADLRERVAGVLSPFGFRIDSSSSALSLEPLVRVRIFVAEVRKNHMTRIGVQWPAATQGQLLPSFALPTDSLPIVLHSLEQDGLAHILASPTLLCRSGKEAQFLAGGEFPIKVASFKSQDVVWKRHGILLAIRPKADLSGRMSIAIETEVSMIDDSRNVDGLPGLLTNRISTHFDLNSSRTIALSGLIKQEWGNSTQGLPGLSAIPVLGALFSSREYRQGKTELVVFVTPEIVTPDDPGVK